MPENAEHRSTLSPSLTPREALSKQMHTSTSCGDGERRSRKKRLQLSCGECRAKKLSCDRNQPCQRCIRSGRPAQCLFETERKKESVSNNSIHQHHAQRSSQEIRDLQTEVAQLKKLLSSTSQQEKSNSVTEASCITIDTVIGQGVQLYEKNGKDQNPVDELSDPRERSPQSFYGQHALMQFFEEIPQLFPFVKETADELLKPLGVYLKKNKSSPKQWKSNAPGREQTSLESLLPSKDETDRLVDFYLNHFEQIHRIIHIPTFNREYSKFWTSGQTRYPAMTALVLSMVSMSICTSNGTGHASISVTYQATATTWIAACENWLMQQSSKCEKFAYYQISCLVFLAKRLNVVRKKRVGKESASLLHDAITDGLHREPPITDPPYMAEMKRRIWFTIRELDLQSTFEYGLPSLLHNINSDVTSPANIDDADFDENLKELPETKPLNKYTSNSYQVHSSQSWILRLEISRRLLSPGLSNPPSYNDVLRYTHELSQALNSLPPWDKARIGDQKGREHILAHAYLRFQLFGCVLAIHRPYLQASDRSFWVSENVCHEMSRDILLLNIKLAGLGVQGVTLIREDLLMASLTLTRIIIQLPKDSTSSIWASSGSTINLLEQCLPILQERYLRCLSGEPWCPMTMSSAIKLLHIHLGSETWQTAKFSCAQQFLDLHYKKVGRQQTALLSQQLPAPQSLTHEVNNVGSFQELPLAIATDLPGSSGLNNTPSWAGFDLLDLNMESDGVWDSYPLWPPT